MIDDARVGLATAGVIEAVRRHDTDSLFDWLMESFSYQGVSDAIAAGYMQKHGYVQAADIVASLKRPRLCAKLASFPQFEDCRYEKSAKTCSRPGNYARCPLPRHKLRNGRLNQTAYSLMLFIRDVAGGDLVGWIDRQLEVADSTDGPDRPGKLANALVEPLLHVYGVSHKVVTMSLASLLLAGDADRERWVTAGAAMIAVDSLVHNWLHRTGILARCNADHGYGARCYHDHGCAELLHSITAAIDARRYDLRFPKTFPRFIQFAIWRFCSQNGLDQCNGNRIDDRYRCDLSDCPIYSACDRIALHAQAEPKAI